ncbi:MAG: HNH endonuclease [Denitromonas halophila]|nr:MAG: HNH endonuclease [Denitromonas halophila]
MPVDNLSSVLSDVSDLITDGRIGCASAVLRERYPFVPAMRTGRKCTPRQMTAVFLRDGFVDRYRGTRLVCPPALRLISHYLPGEFPYHKNGKMDLGHVAYWELFPTIDHVHPVARGGTDSEDNWVTCSMTTNSIKANWTLEQLGWRLLPPGKQDEWDGLLNWFVEQVDRDPSLLAESYFKRWIGAARDCREAR